MAKRPTHVMPADVKSALKAGGIEADYAARPHYQRNDYLGWIAQAATDETRQERLAQMTAELKAGGIYYMGMKHAPSAKA